VGIYVLSVVDVGVEDWGGCYVVFEVILPETHRGDVLSWGVNYHDTVLYKQTRQRDSVKNFFTACKIKLRTETPTEDDLRECLGCAVSARLIGQNNIHEFYRYSPGSLHKRNTKKRVGRRSILRCGLKRFYEAPHGRFEVTEGFLQRLLQYPCGLNISIHPLEGQTLHVAG
jgi:hypothetical protein